MGNSHSSEKHGIPYRRRLSKHQATSGWVHIAGENDDDGLPTTPLSGAYHGQDDAIPTVPKFALLQTQSLSSIQWTKNSPSLGHDLSAPAGCYKSRPSRHSTDTFHPLRSAPVSGSARAASLEENEGLGNDVESKRLDDRYFSSPPALSSSSSTESWRTLSSDSDASKDLPHYIPHRRRSLQQIPGLGTRPEKIESDTALHRTNVPTSSVRSPYSPFVQAETEPAPLLTPTQSGALDDLGNSTEAGYRQLGSIRLGSLRIMNGSPLSMRRDEANLDEAAGVDADMSDNQTSSGDAAISHHTSPSESPPNETRENPTSSAHLPIDSSDPLPQESRSSMHIGETVRGRQGRFSGDNPRISVETLRAGIPSVVNDEQLKLTRRQSTGASADDSSSVYSDNFIPVMLSDDIIQHKQTNTDNSNGPQLSFQSFRNLIRQNRVKSYLQANNKAAPMEKLSDQSTASGQDPFTEAPAQVPSTSRRKLAKKHSRVTSPSVSSSSSIEPYNRKATKPLPLPRQTPKGRIIGQQRNGHVSSKSDGQVVQIRSPAPEEYSAPRIAQHVEHSLHNRSSGYRTTSERVPIFLDRASAIPRAHVSFRGDVSKQVHGSIRVEQLRRSQTAEFKPLPTPKPDLPQRRRPIKIPEPIPTGFGIRSSYESHREPQTRQDIYSPTPSHVRSRMMPLVAQPYRPYHDEDDDEPQLFSLHEDSPFVSPLDDEDLWPRDTATQTVTKPSTSFQPREVSPIRHARSMPSIQNSPARPLRTPAPISTHSRRAVELAERWQQQQRQRQWQRQTPGTLLDQPRLSNFYEHVPSRRPMTAGGIDEYDASSFLFVERDTSLPPIVYRNGMRRGSEISSAMWRPPYRVLHSYYSPAYRNAPIWG